MRVCVREREVGEREYVQCSQGGVSQREGGGRGGGQEDGAEEQEEV